MSPRTIAAGAALLLSLALPAAAQAVPTMDPLKPCYVTADTPKGHQMEGFDIRAAGFTPNSIVDLAVDGQPVASGTKGLQTDTSGAIGTPVPLDPFPAPFVAKGIRPFTVTLTEQGNPGNRVEMTSKTTALGVKVKPRSNVKPQQRIRFKGLGFTKDKPIYAHYLHKGKLRKTVRMARRPGECGSFNARRRQIPVRKPGLGKWVVQFDQSSKRVRPAKRAIVFVRLDITVRLVRR